MKKTHGVCAGWLSRITNRLSGGKIRLLPLLALLVWPVVTVAQTSPASANVGPPNCVLATGGSAHSNGVITTVGGFGQVSCDGAVGAINIFVDIQRTGSGVIVAASNAACPGPTVSCRATIAPTDDATFQIFQCYYVNANASVSGGIVNPTSSSRICG
jgi:hypothetical protein